MAKWTVGMDGEKDGRAVLPDGDNILQIESVVFLSKEESGSGKPYFKWDLKSPLGNINMVTTLIKGKRWLLKQTLFACGIESKEDDPEQKYAFSPEDVVGKYIVAQIKNVKNTFTGRDGNEVTFDKSEVKRVKKYEKKAETTKSADIESVESETVEDNKIPF